MKTWKNTCWLLLCFTSCLSVEWKYTVTCLVPVTSLVRYSPRQKNGSLPICSVCNWTNYNPWIFSCPFSCSSVSPTHTHTCTDSHTCLFSPHSRACFLSCFLSACCLHSTLSMCLVFVLVGWCLDWFCLGRCSSLSLFNPPFCTNSGFCVQYLG